MKFLKQPWFLQSALTTGDLGCSKDETTNFTVPTDSADSTDSIDAPDPADLLPTSDLTAYFDPLFAQELQRRGYITDANKITFAEVKGITELDVSGEYVPNEHRYDGRLTSLRGIEFFESLTTLTCDGNRLTALELSKNSALIELLCDCNQLTALDVSQNTALTRLGCFNNRLTALDVSQNTALTHMDCGSNQLTALDVSKNTALIYLDCGYNQLTALDISNDTALTELYCGSNRLTALDVSQNTALTSMYCYENRLTALDISQNMALTSLNCGHNPGDGTVFPVTAWFDNSAILEVPVGPGSGHITTGSWDCDGTKITVDYRKAE